jgi:hypothetical protein
MLHPIQDVTHLYTSTKVLDQNIGIALSVSLIFIICAEIIKCVLTKPPQK